MHDGMPYGRIQGRGQGHSREVDRQSPTGLIFYSLYFILVQLTLLCLVVYGSTVSAPRVLLSFFIPNVFIFFCLIFNALREWNK